MMTAAFVLLQAAAGAQWVGVLLPILGVLGGAGGITAIATVLIQRGKFKADTANVLTDTALTLVAPLRARVTELEDQAVMVRKRTVAANIEIDELRDSMQDLKATMQRWRAAAQDPDVTTEQLRDIIARLNRNSLA